MEIITPRMAIVPLGFKKFGAREGYCGEREVMPRALAPVSENHTYSSLYLLERENILSKTFDWMYVINQQWIEENKKNIFNHSHSNSKIFDEFVERMQFPSLNNSFLEHKIINPKERNHLITMLDIPIESVDKILVYRYPGHFRTLSYLRALFPQNKEIRYFEKIGGYQANKLAKLHEFIIK